ncbi:TonB family protein [Pseudoxanthomonas composti]|uniref:TonB family protein n=1 Tax=Pseudoxanthomonas composti TaxID=2137479 RepID=A0A4Q1JW34_9GAMM|nr:TonB family protein [Pseudoxanthomonas composti]RXR06375.1 TonB family protein [Pseudoxanthomonas composti]
MTRSTGRFRSLLTLSLLLVVHAAAATHSEADAAGTAAWAGAIQQAVMARWTYPDGEVQNVPCRLSLTLSASGIVESASLVAPCGTPALERSVVRAALSASPLPLPKDRKLFRRELILSFSKP